MADAMLRLAGVNTHIDQYHILQGVDFDVPAGAVTMLLGRNGAGKTTTLRTIMGLWKASAGSIHFNGRSIETMPTADIAQSGIAFVPEEMAVFADLTVKENLILAARNGPIDDQRLDWLFGLFPAMKTFWNLHAGALSGGQKQMLAIARAIVEPRQLLLVDEPTKGLAPVIVGALRDAFLELKQQGVTILMVEQNFLFASALGDSVAVMDNGRIIHTGTMAELNDDESLKHRLLGLSLETEGHP